MDCNSVFKVCRWFAVSSTASPAVTLKHYILASHINHWLYCDYQSILDKRSGSATAIIWHFWILMQFLSHSMTGKFSHYRISSLFAIFLYRVAYICYSFAFFSYFDSHIQRFLCCLKQSFHLRCIFTHAECVS